MIAVGIDVSKSKSTVAILDSYGTVLATPFNMAHTQPEMNALVSRLKAFDEPVTILLEYNLNPSSIISLPGRNAAKTSSVDFLYTSPAEKERS